MFFRTEVLVLVLIASFVKGVHVGDGKPSVEFSELQLMHSRGTYYTPGLGACGRHNNKADFIVSMAHGTFDNFP